MELSTEAFIACEKVYESIMPMLDLDDKEIAEVFSLEEDELVRLLVNKKTANINMEVPSSSSEELINEVDLKMAHTLFRVYQDRILKEKEKKLV